MQVAIRMFRTAFATGGCCREQWRYRFFHRARKKLWKLFLDSKL
jgi:hypothetical protein